MKVKHLVESRLMEADRDFDHLEYEVVQNRKGDLRATFELDADRTRSVKFILKQGELHDFSKFKDVWQEADADFDDLPSWVQNTLIAVDQIAAEEAMRKAEEKRAKMVAKAARQQKAQARYDASFERSIRTLMNQLRRLRF